MSNPNEAPLDDTMLTPQERDTICEMTSIAMGAAGSTLSMLLGQEVEVPTPTVTQYASLADMDVPFGDSPKMLVVLKYNKGISATALFIIKDSDSRELAKSMMGSEESADGEPLTELETGALGELMNQMMNAAATGLASLIHEPVEVNNPQVIPYTSDALAEALPSMLTEPFIGTHIQLKGGDALTIELIELRMTSEVKTHVAKLMAMQPGNGNNAEVLNETMSLDDLMASIAEPAMAGAAMGKGPAPAARGVNVDPVTVRPVEFTSFDQQPHIFGEENKNLALVMDVHLNLTVELGKTDLSIKDVLELTRGSVIELERVAGEPVDLMANGKLIAKGEVVVIEDNFGLRITSIVSPADRLRGLQ
jgi:flagellar motor switch protein FliN/FliY